MTVCYLYIQYAHTMAACPTGLYLMHVHKTLSVAPQGCKHRCIGLGNHGQMNRWVAGCRCNAQMHKMQIQLCSRGHGRVRVSDPHYMLTMWICSTGHCHYHALSTHLADGCTSKFAAELCHGHGSCSRSFAWSFAAQRLLIIMIR